MSEPKRYKVGKIGTTEMIDCVSYADYARIKAEVEELQRLLTASTYYNSSDELERLKAEVDRLEEIVGSDAIDRKYGMCCDASDEIARLKAEVERLTKAGDAMAEIFKNEMDNEPDCVGYLQEQLFNRWNAAKEGKPRA